MASIRCIFVEVIDKTFEWGFFDGSAAGEPKYVELEVCCLSRMNIIYL